MKLRHEYKHWINRSDLIQLKTRLDKIMTHDPHCDDDGTYYIKSLYFDNCYDKALIEKNIGLPRREKFRIRYYGTDTSFIRLEKKSKIDGLCNKQQTKLTADEVERIINGDYEFLRDSGDELKQELYAKMKYQLLRPINVVCYRRECFVYGPGNVRVTLDYQIAGSYKVRDFLKPELYPLNLWHLAVLEVKWDEYLPSIIRDAVQLGERKSSGFSKYNAVRF